MGIRISVHKARWCDRSLEPFFLPHVCLHLPPPVVSQGALRGIVTKPCGYALASLQAFVGVVVLLVRCLLHVGPCGKQRSNANSCEMLAGFRWAPAIHCGIYRFLAN